MSGGRILIGMTSHSELGNTGRSTGAYIPEVADAWKVFSDAGYEVDLMSVRGGTPPLDAVDRSDPVQLAFLDDPVMSARLSDTLVAVDVDLDRYAAVFFAGGHGAAWDLPSDRPTIELTRRAYESGRVVGAVCHGPCALVNVVLSDGTYLVAGRKVAAFTDDEEKAIGMTYVVPFLQARALEEHGAWHVPGPSFLPHAVVDGRLVTGQNPASATVTAQAVVNVLAQSS
jgi:putative intracellular protease/amidase